MVQDLPEVPSTEPEGIKEELDLPDVPTKTPAAASTKTKGMYDQHLSSTFPSLPILIIC